MVAGLVLVYLLCIVLIAAPILIAEILIGRASQKGAVGAFPALAGRNRLEFGGHFGPHRSHGLVVLRRDWRLDHYAWLYISGGMPESSEEIAGVIGKTATAPPPLAGGMACSCCAVSPWSSVGFEAASNVRPRC